MQEVRKLLLEKSEVDNGMSNFEMLISEGKMLLGRRSYDLGFTIEPQDKDPQRGRWIVAPVHRLQIRIESGEDKFLSCWLRLSPRDSKLQFQRKF